MHEKVHLGYGLHSTRLTNPAIEISELPPLDFIILSHFHGDHFDQVATRELDKSLTIIATPHAPEELEIRAFTNAKKLDTWDSVSFKKGNLVLKLPQLLEGMAHFLSLPSSHKSCEVSLTFTEMMYISLEYTLQAIQWCMMILRKYLSVIPNVDLALLHIGGTTVMGIMITMDGKEGVKMFNIIKPKKAIPIHYNEYDVFKSPIEELQHEAQQAGIDNHIQYLKHGETYQFSIVKTHG